MQVCMNMHTIYAYEYSQIYGYSQIRVWKTERLYFLGVESFWILLRRLAYPNRLVDLEPIFGISSAALSSVINCLVNVIAINKGHLLQNLRNVPYLNQEKLRQYSQVKPFHI